MMHSRVEERPTVRKALTMATKTDFMGAFHDAAGNFLHCPATKEKGRCFGLGSLQGCLTPMLQIRQICHNAFELPRNVYVRSLLFSWILIALVGSVLRGEEDSTLSVDVNVMNVLPTVRNKQGQIVHDLNQGEP
jgi:hypothetical protein